MKGLLQKSSADVMNKLYAFSGCIPCSMSLKAHSTANMSPSPAASYALLVIDPNACCGVGWGWNSERLMRHAYFFMMFPPPPPVSSYASPALGVPCQQVRMGREVRGAAGWTSACDRRGVPG